MRLLGLFTRVEPADGASPALEAVATGIGPETLAAAAEMAPSRRRERAADPGSAVISEVLAAKVMHGWLQNRHQTLVPMTLNLGVLSSEKAAAVAQALAAFVLIGRPGGDAQQAAPGLRTWLAGLGADASTLTRFDEAMQVPGALHQVLEQMSAFGLTVYAYVASLMASDTRFPASEALCDLVQARYDLPSAVVRTANRRYRR